MVGMKQLGLQRLGFKKCTKITSKSYDIVAVSHYQSAFHSPIFHMVRWDDGTSEDGVTPKGYQYFSKQFGVLYWMARLEETVREGDIIVLMDPNQLLTKPITHDFCESSSNYGLKHIQKPS